MKFFFTIFSLVLFVAALYGQRPSNINVSDAVNYKMAEPSGFGEDHFIEIGRDITYTIFFQNTGSDTVYNLRVVDTLSLHLDISTIRQEGASHSYLMTLLEDNVVRFSFANIHLPNSAVNESTSKGFVTFTISQRENLPLMSFIPNKAAVYFDFEPPVFTNTVFHTIGDDFTGTNRGLWPELSISVYPNPMREKAVFDLHGVSFHIGELQVFSANGQLWHTQEFSKSRFDFTSLQLYPGQYFYKIKLDGQPATTGKFSVN